MYIENGRLESDFVFTEILITEINGLNTSTKDMYYKNLAKRLNNPLLQCKQKHIGQFLKLFITTKKSYNSTSFDR